MDNKSLMKQIKAIAHMIEAEKWYWVSHKESADKACCKKTMSLLIKNIDNMDKIIKLMMKEK